MTGYRASTALLALAVVACAGSPESAPDAGGDADRRVTPGTWTDYVGFISSLVAAQCDKRVACGLMDSAQHNACVQGYGVALLSNSTARSLSLGTQVFDTTAAGECLTNVGLPCDEWIRSQCPAYLLPQAGRGDRCYSPADCRDGVYCTGAACAQTCQDYYGFRAPGEACDLSLLPCDQSRGSCDTSSSPSTCVPSIEDGQPCSGAGVPAGASCGVETSYCGNDGRCQAFLEEGSACDIRMSARCKPGLFCRADTSGAGPSNAGACAPQLGFGLTCSLSLQCQSGLACDSATHTCRPYAAHLGDACSTSQFCVSSFCQGARGDTLGTCTAPALVGSAEQCSTEAMPTIACEAGLFCSRGSSTCEPLRSTGEPCNDDDECKHLLVCSAATGSGPMQCTPSPMPGESCAAQACALVYTCNPATATCRSAQGDGASCAFSWDCVSGNCADTVCAPACGP